MNKLHKTVMPDPENALPGRSAPITTSDKHVVLGTPIKPPFPEGLGMAMFGMGCFWGAERKFWNLTGVHSTAVGYSAGYTPNPTYEEVCTGRTGHNEVVLVVFDPSKMTFAGLLKVFWEAHDPTQGMRQGNDIGTQYRSGIYYYSEQQKRMAESTRDKFQAAVDGAGLGEITTEVIPAGEFYYAEGYHQQYLARNPGGYCGLGGTGVCLPETRQVF